MFPAESICCPITYLIGLYASILDSVCVHLCINALEVIFWWALYWFPLLFQIALRAGKCFILCIRTLQWLYDCINNRYGSPAMEYHIQQILNFLLVVHNKNILKSKYSEKADAMTTVTIHCCLRICMPQKYMSSEYGKIPRKMWNKQ